MKNSRGLTILELLATVTIGMFILTSSFPAISSFLSKIEISNAVSSITSHLSEARYLSLSESRRVKFSVVKGSGRLEIIKNHKWINYKSWEIKGKISITCNSSPVFNPKGTASPMCTIRISNKMYSYKITLSFAGRIKVKKRIY